MEVPTSKVRKKNGRPKILPPTDYLPSEDQSQDPHVLRAIGRAWGWRRRMGCCQTNEPKHQYLVAGYFYEVTKERHSVRAASRLSLNVLRFESDLCKLNRL
jgi:hypothetical protein